MLKCSQMAVLRARESKWINRGRHSLIIWFPVLVTATQAKKLNECETCTLFSSSSSPPHRHNESTGEQRRFLRFSRWEVNVTEKRVSSPSNGQESVCQIVLFLTSNLNRPEKRGDNVSTAERGKERGEKRMKVVSALTLSLSRCYLCWLFSSPASQVTK